MQTSLFKRSPSSLFIRLISGFLIVIILLLSFHFASFYYLKDRYRDKLIAYNQGSLSNTVATFGDLFTATQNVLSSLYAKDQVNLLHSQLLNPEDGMSQMNIKLLSESLAETIRSNPHLYLENIFLVMQKPSSIIAKDGMTDAGLLFNKYVESEYFDTAFWTGQFQESYVSRIVPTTINMPDSVEKQTRSFAMIVKNRFMGEMYLVAFINIPKAYSHLHHAQDNLWIADENGRLFDAASPPEIDMSDLKGNAGNLYVHSNFYFYQKDVQTGLTYLNRIPDNSIQTEISKLYVFLIPVLLAALAISIGVSVLISMSINNPIKNIVESMQNYMLPKPVQSNIKEFQRISEHLLSMEDKSNKADQDLQESKSLLKYYAYANKLKAIKTDMPHGEELDFSHAPFLFVLFRLHFRKSEGPLFQIDPERAAYYIREFIHPIVEEKFPGSLTFQMEKDEIVSLVFIGASARSELEEAMHAIKKVMDLDAHYCLLTIGISSVYEHSTALTEAYEEAKALIQQRQMLEETQIIAHSRSPLTFIMSTQQEQELQGYLQAGSREAAQAWVHKLLKQLENKQATADQVAQFAAQVVKKAKQTLHALKLDNETIDTLAAELEHCFSYKDYGQLLSAFIEAATDKVQTKKGDHDQLIAFVTQYIHEHYKEDVSLDVVADRLKITSGYLSTYFKEATGVNFKDYVTKIRMEEAKRLLLKSDLKVQEISERVGYPNITPFIRMFRKYTGETPGEFRKQISG